MATAPCEQSVSIFSSYYFPTVCTIVLTLKSISAMVFLLWVAKFFYNYQYGRQTMWPKCVIFISPVLYVSLYGHIKFHDCSVLHFGFMHECMKIEPSWNGYLHAADMFCNEKVDFTNGRKDLVMNMRANLGVDWRCGLRQEDCWIFGANPA